MRKAVVVVSAREDEEALAGCDHHGECPTPRQHAGCRWTQFQRTYVNCECGGWDEFWTSRSNDTRLAGRSNHRHTCQAERTERLVTEAVAAERDRVAAAIEALTWTESARDDVLTIARTPAPDSRST